MALEPAGREAGLAVEKPVPGGQRRGGVAQGMAAHGFLVQQLPGLPAGRSGPRRQADGVRVAGVQAVGGGQRLPRVGTDRRRHRQRLHQGDRDMGQARGGAGPRELHADPDVVGIQVGGAAQVEKRGLEVLQAETGRPEQGQAAGRQVGPGREQAACRPVPLGRDQAASGFDDVRLHDDSLPRPAGYLPAPAGGGKPECQDPRHL